MGARIGLAVVLLGVAMLAYPGYQTYEHYQEPTTVTTEGEILTAEIDPGRYYEIDLRYRYEYDGKQYTNDNVFRGAERKYSFRDGAEEDIERYGLKTGESVTVHVRTEEPTQSYIVDPDRATLPQLYWPLVGVGLALLLGGCRALYETVRERREPEQTLG